MMHGKGLHVGVGIVGEQLALDDVRILDDLRDVVDRADGDFGLFEERHVFRLRAPRDEGADDRIQLLGMFDALGVDAEFRVLGQFWPADRTEHALGHLLRRGRQAHVAAVLAAVGIARARVGRAAAGARLHLSRQPVVRRLRPEHGKQGIEQRQVDDLPLAAALGFAQGDQCRRRAVQPGDGVGEVHRRQYRLAVAEPVHGSETRQSLDQRAEAGTPPVRSILAPARYADDHQLRVRPQEFLRREFHRLQRAGTEALDEDRRGRHEFQQQFACFWPAQLQAFFVAPIQLPVGRDALRLPGAQRVARGRLDLHHLGAEIAQHLCQRIAGDQAREIEHAHAMQRAARLWGVVPLLQHAPTPPGCRRPSPPSSSDRCRESSRRKPPASPAPVPRPRSAGTPSSRRKPGPC